MINQKYFIWKKAFEQETIFLAFEKDIIQYFISFNYVYG